MPDSPTPGSSTTGPAAADRLDSWKEIAAYMRRDVTTVQRWEKREGMPVHRHLHDKVGSVYAFRPDLDAWARGRTQLVGPEGEAAAARPEPVGPDGDTAGAPGGHAAAPPPGASARTRVTASPRSGGVVLTLAAAGTVLALAAAAWQLRDGSARENPLAGARFVPLTDFDGIEQAAALSRDGRFVAFQSDRDGRMDVWVGQIGTGLFVNLTRGGAPEIANPNVRTLGFTPDGSLVTFWARGPGGKDGPTPADIGVWAAPLLGGPPRPYLDGVAEYDWTADGTRLVYHTPGPGDPMYVRASGSADARNVFAAPAGLHAHFLAWAPDAAFVYFVQGTLPDRLDLWRVRPDGGAPERLTHHDALVSHPVFLDARTLLYLASDADGSGPWIHGLDAVTLESRRVTLGADSYTSLAASADGRRLVATRASPKRALWRVPLDGARADMAAARRVSLATGDGSAPRLGPDYLVYVSSKGATDSLWKLQGGAATELWTAPDARIVGAPAIRRDGRCIAFTARQGGRTALHVVNADGSEARTVTRELVLQGAPAWAPDGKAVTIAAVKDGGPRLLRIPVDGGAPEQLVAEHSVDPAWSPDGGVLAFSGPDVGTTFPVKAVDADGSARRAHALTLTRGARHLAFTPDGRALLVLRGKIRHKNLWAIDLDTGAERQLTDVGPEFDLRDFDVSPDGRELVLEQVQEQSDVVMIELPAR